jgi:ribulose-5-phosphate 4-epimerase/fuculose-1-phosphate aldolase
LDSELQSIFDSRMIMETAESRMMLTSGDTLAKTWRLCGRLNLVDTVFNHISVRLDSESHDIRFLMNRSDRLAGDACADELAVVEMSTTSSDAIQAGVLLHRAIYRHRSDVRAIIHLHSRGAVAVSALQCGLLGLTQTAMEFMDEIAYCDFAGVVETSEEGDRVATILGNKPCALLRNHGLLTVGNSVQEAFYLAYYLELSCRDQIDILSCRRQEVLPDPQVQVLAREQLKSQRASAATSVWNAMIRFYEQNGQ